MTSKLHAIARRELLLASGVLFAWAHLPKVARAEGRDPRLLVIVLRGALDGLATVAPVGDPDWLKLRGERALVLDGKTPALPLDGLFALNPAMPNLHRLYQAGQAAIVHAVATPYRERSHFDGQDMLESGLDRPGRSDTGWLNRALLAIEPEAKVRSDNRRAFAVGPIAPLLVRGAAPVLSWTPPRLPPAGDDTTLRLIELYRHTDPALARAVEARTGLVAMTRDGDMPSLTPPTVQSTAVGLARAREYFAETAGTAARYLARPEGPRVGALSFNGWDTHINEGAVGGLLAGLLGALDGAIYAIESNMGEAWRDTSVAIVTEFGRTARINGTEGTDHGTGTVALLFGGALQGGRVIADWPGLKDADLHDNRDLKATTDLRAVLKGLLRDHLRIDDARLAADIFPGSEAIKPMAGLMRTA